MSQFGAGHVPGGGCSAGFRTAAESGIVQRYKADPVFRVDLADGGVATGINGCKAEQRPGSTVAN